jgi:hypothetical protein
LDERPSFGAGAGGFSSVLEDEDEESDFDDYLDEDEDDED